MRRTKPSNSPPEQQKSETNVLDDSELKKALRALTMKEAFQTTVEYKKDISTMRQVGRRARLSFPGDCIPPNERSCPHAGALVAHMGPGTLHQIRAQLAIQRFTRASRG